MRIRITLRVILEKGKDIAEGAGLILQFQRLFFFRVADELVIRLS